MTHEQHARILWRSWGRNLRRARSGRFTQEQLAEELGVTQSSISEWETGERDIPDAMKFRICDVLGRSLADLFPWPDFMPPERRD